MTIAYQKAILAELGPDRSAELAENCCVFLVNYHDLTYTFQNCPPLLLEKMIARKESKGPASILAEFLPEKDWRTL